jgi:hypothetical protein
MDEVTAWTSDELIRIGASDELEIVSLRRDGTLRDPVTIWVVRHGGDLYVRRRRTGLRHFGNAGAVPDVLLAHRQGRPRPPPADEIAAVSRS